METPMFFRFPNQRLSESQAGGGRFPLPWPWSGEISNYKLYPPATIILL